MSWLVAESGRVASASLASSTLRDATVEACVLDSVRRFGFPASSTATTVRYPFVLRQL